MRDLSALRNCVVFVGLTALVACNSADDKPEQTAPDADLEAAVDAPSLDDALAQEGATADAPAEAAPHPSLAIFVGDATDMVPGPGVTPKPLAGATVAFDHPVLGRLEVVTDSKGEATIANVPPADGYCPLSIHKQGFGIQSDFPRCDLTNAAGKYVLSPLGGALLPKMITLSGTAKGMKSNSNYLLVNSNTWPVPLPSSSQKPGNTFVINALPDAPLSLIGVEFKPCNTSKWICQDLLQWTRLDHAASSTDLTLDLDFANSLPPTHAKGSMTVPKRILADSFQPRLLVTSYAERISHGFATRMDDGTAPGNLVFDADYVEWAGSTDVYTVYRLEAPKAMSIVRRPSYPVDGADVSDFLDLPEFVSPKDITVPITLLDTIEWVPQPGVQSSYFFLLRGSDIVWSIATTTSKFSFPKPPSSVDLLELLGAAPLGLSLSMNAETDPTTKQFARSVYHFGLTLQP